MATFGFEPDSIAKSIRTIINNNFFLRLAKVNFIDLKTQIIFSNMGELYYDYLILATGSLATGSLATGSLATGSLATGSLATGSLATGSLATGSKTNWHYQ